MARFLSAMVLLAAGLVAACQRFGAPAPFELHTHQGPPALSEPVPASHPNRIAVADGDTLYAISRRYGVPMRAIIDANRLTPPFRLVRGTNLALPQVRTHLVRPGDTLASVARQHGVDASTLASANHLAPPYVIRTGETLVLPAAVEGAAPPSGQPAPRAAPDVAIAALPPVAGASSVPPPSAPPATAPLITNEAARVTAPPPAAGMKPEPEIAALPPVPPLPLPGKGFVWPVRGRILAGYGPTPQGTQNDGINIAAPEGTPVLAADAGEVAYAGNELRGYGNLILIKHPNGFITAYGHNETLLVKRGQHVARGQPIAKVGATGAVSESQLHFEIRRGTRVLDPGDYLPAQTATTQ